MDLFDFFFPEQAQASHLRKIARQRTIPARQTSTDHTAEIEALQQDVNFLTLVVTALLRRLAETETASLGDVQDLVDEIDALDGVADGGLSPGVLRGLLGVLKGSATEQESKTAEEFKIVSTPRYRNR